MSLRVPWLVFGLLLVAVPAWAVHVSPNPVLIDAAYRGGEIEVSGPTAPDHQVFVTITGSSIEEDFNRKGRIGPLWANVGKLRISGAPSLCLVASSGGAPKGLDEEVVGAHRLDLAAVVRRTEVKPPRDVALMQREYLRLKRSQGVYGHFAGAVRLVGAGADSRFVARIPWPDRAKTGRYAVDVVQLSRGVVVGHQTATLDVKLVGLPRLISYLAFQKSALYGFLSVVIALSVGFMTGLVFKKGASH